jgi:cysteine desulfurase/selenocysteine lyase
VTALSDSALADLRQTDFPWTSRGDCVFLNHASTGPLPRRAVTALNALAELRAEPWRFSAELQFGTLARSRELCARLIGASPDEIALMVNTSYGLNLAARCLPFAPGDVVITSDREYPSNIYPWMALENTRGVSLERVPCAGRVPDEEAIIAALGRPHVRALVLSWVSFESGYRIDLRRLGEACHARGIFFIVDAIQGVSGAPINVHDLPIDILACGAQKWLLSPWGTGFVYIRRGLVQTLEPVDVSWMAVRDSDDFSRLIDYNFTWRDDARRFEVITLPYQDFGGLNASLELFFEVGLETVLGRVERLATQVIDWAARRRDMRVVTPADPAKRAGVVAIIPPDVEAASLRLTHAGVVHSLREGAIRLSPHFYVTEEEIDRALGVLAGAASA